MVHLVSRGLLRAFATLAALVTQLPQRSGDHERRASAGSVRADIEVEKMGMGSSSRAWRGSDSACRRHVLLTLIFHTPTVAPGG